MTTRSQDEFRDMLRTCSRIAVIGMKDSGAAYEVPLYMEGHGYEILPVNPTYDDIDGRQVYDRVTDIDEKVDMVNIFRRSEAVPEHAEEILEMDPLPDVVWMQVGVRNERAADELRKADIEVVQDICLKVVHARLRL